MTTTDRPQYRSIGTRAKRTEGPTRGAYIVKIDQNLNQQWDHSYNFAFNQFLNSVVELSNHTGYLVLGTLADTNYRTSAYLMRLDNTGDTLWTREYTVGSSQDGCFGIYLEENVIGISEDQGTGSSSTGLYAMDSIGNIIDTIVVGGDYNPNIIPCENGYLFTSMNSNNPNANPDFVLSRYDSIGPYTFTVWFQDTNLIASHEFYSAMLYNDTISSVGRTDLYTGGSYKEMAIINTDQAGNLLSIDHFGNGVLGGIYNYNNNGRLYSGLEDSVGVWISFLWRSHARDTIWLMKMNPDIRISCALVLPNGNIAVVGDSGSITTDVWFTPLDSLGNRLPSNFQAGIQTVKTNHVFSITIFPNPSSGTIHVQSDEPLTIFNALGQVVKYNVSNENIQLARGIYYAKCSSEPSYTQKIVVQ